MKLKTILVLFVLIVLSKNLYSQYSAFDFLRLDTSPRAAALAGSFVANADDPNVIFYNPAGIGALENSPISFSFLKHLVDINSASLAVSADFEGIGRFGAGVQYINYGDFIRADANGAKNGNFGAGDIAFLIGYANQLEQNFYYGANVKFIYSGIEDHSSTGIAVDLGLNYVIPDSRWTFGFSVLNLGSQLSSYINTKEDLPLDIRLGFTKQLEHLPFTFYGSIIKLNEKQDNILDRFKQFTFGGEIRLGKAVKFRLGFDNEKRKELKIGTSAGLAGFHFGLGINIKKYNLDYAFSQLGSIGNLHRIGISTNL
jgi:hypothetical protein